MRNTPAGDLIRWWGELIGGLRKVMPSTENGVRKLNKLLMNVTVEESLGPVQVVMSPENAVVDLIKAAVEVYVREKMRPLLKDTNPNCFELHYSKFSLESLKREEKLMNLGSRNFFMCQIKG